MKNGLFTCHDIAEALDVSSLTIKRWVWWYEEKVEEGYDFSEQIPEYTIDCQGVRLWEATPETINQFKAFRESLGKNPFAEYNALHHWGRRGKDIASRKNMNT